MTDYQYLPQARESIDQLGSALRQPGLPGANYEPIPFDASPHGAAFVVRFPPLSELFGGPPLELAVGADRFVVVYRSAAGSAPSVATLCAGVATDVRASNLESILIAVNAYNRASPNTAFASPHGDGLDVLLKVAVVPIALVSNPSFFQALVGAVLADVVSVREELEARRAVGDGVYWSEQSIRRVLEGIRI
jgi:hypothetical protein